MSIVNRYEWICIIWPFCGEWNAGNMLGVRPEKKTEIFI